MPKAKKFIVCDTETGGLGNNAIVYDFAYTVCTRKNTLLERSFLIRETITDPDVMMQSYYAKKIFTHYIPALNDGLIKLFNWIDVIEQLRDDILTHDVSVFCAYNLPFDMGAIKLTQNNILGSDKVLPHKLDLLDLYLFSTTTALNTKLYHDTARANGWISDAGNVRTTAEKSFAFLTGQLDFVEAHTALEDAQIETEILQRLLARRKRIPYNQLRAMAWQYAQKLEQPKLI